MQGKQLLQSFPFLLRRTAVQADHHLQSQRKTRSCNPICSIPHILCGVTPMIFLQDRILHALCSQFNSSHMKLLQSLQNLRCNAVGTGGNPNPCHALHR